MAVRNGAWRAPRPANQLRITRMRILIACVGRSGLRQMAPQQAVASLRATVDPLVFAADAARLQMLLDSRQFERYEVQPAPT